MSWNPNPYGRIIGTCKRHQEFWFERSQCQSCIAERKAREVEKKSKTEGEGA